MTSTNGVRARPETGWGQAFEELQTIVERSGIAPESFFDRRQGPVMKREGRQLAKLDHRAAARSDRFNLAVPNRRFHLSARPSEHVRRSIDRDAP